MEVVAMKSNRTQEEQCINLDLRLMGYLNLNAKVPDCRSRNPPVVESAVGGG